MEEFWDALVEKAAAGKLTGREKKVYKQLVKAIQFLETNPRHPGLNSHEIPALTKRYGLKVWQSYLANNTPGAGRLFWVYAPKKNDITIIGIEPHPNDKKDSYKKIKLSALSNE